MALFQAPKLQISSAFDSGNIEVSTSTAQAANSGIYCTAEGRVVLPHMECSVALLLLLLLPLMLLQLLQMLLLMSIATTKIATTKTC
jgi:hypothetical protein